jgi:hypothetical protein
VEGVFRDLMALVNQLEDKGSRSALLQTLRHIQGTMIFLRRGLGHVSSAQRNKADHALLISIKRLYKLFQRIDSCSSLTASGGIKGQNTLKSYNKSVK